jgi:type IV secretion system protein TrbL
MPVPIWDAGVLSSALDAINSAGDGAMSALMPTVESLFFWVKSLTFCMVMGVMLLTRRFPHPDFARMLLVFAVVGWMIDIYPTAADRVIQAMANTGTIVAPDMQFNLNDPGAIALFGFQAAVPMMTMARQFLGPVAIFLHFFEFVFHLFAIVMIILAFLVMALHIFFAQIEYLLLSIAAFVTLPFAAFSKTSFIATKGVGYIASVGLRMLALSLLSALSTVALLMFEKAKITGLGGAFGLVALSAGLLVAIIKAPSAAAALINSGPILDGAMALRAMRIGAANGMQALSQMTAQGGMSGSIARGVSSVASVASGMASAGVAMARNAWSAGSSSSSSSSGSSQSGQAGKGGQSTSTQGRYRGGWSRGSQPSDTSQ